MPIETRGPENEHESLTPEQCAKLFEHPEFQGGEGHKGFIASMREDFYEQVKDSELAPDMKEFQFDRFIKDNSKTIVNHFIERGYLKDWKQFLSERQEPVEQEYLSDKYDYFDRESMRPLLEKLVTLSSDELKKSGLDYVVLTYFLLGPPGKVDYTWPVFVSGESITREKYIEKVKQLEEYFEGVNRTELKTGENIETKEKNKREAKDWREVERKVEVDAVGDLHSNYRALVENLKSLGAAEEGPDGKLRWIGGNRKVVLIGDVLADRNMGGTDILLARRELKAQAAEAGGELELIAGNHDDFETAYLMGRNAAGGGNPLDNACLENQGVGLLELREFGPDELKNYDLNNYKSTEVEMNIRGEVSRIISRDPIWDLMEKHQSEILKNMRESEKGKRILEELCDMKLAVVHDDILYLHTNITQEIADYLLKYPDIEEGVTALNKYYQRNLKKVLLDNQEPQEHFDGLRAMFLNTDNRVNFDNLSERMTERVKNLTGLSNDEYTRQRNEIESDEKIIIAVTQMAFKKQGINAIFHGHTGAYAGKGISNPDFPIESVDLSAFKYSDSDARRSIIKVHKDGTIDKGTNIKSGQQLVPIRSR